jgi:4-hydroxy-2-oxoheptanedioate aldolase
MPISGRLARLMRESQPAIGMWINLTDPGVTQIAALAGYDWVMIDTEHNPFTESQVQALLHSLREHDVTPVVRVRGNREECVKWVLDAGAGGIVIPSLKDAEDARHAVEIAKYFPLGRRGFGPNRASDFSTKSSQYVETANQEIVLIGQIELASAVAEAKAICEMPGMDGVWIGPTDLAQSLGHLGNPNHPDVQTAINTVIEAASQHSRAWGIPTGSVDDYERYLKRGAIIMTLGSDSRILLNGGSELVRRARLAAPSGRSER